jgi:hypothetical protein
MVDSQTGMLSSGVLEKRLRSLIGDFEAVPRHCWWRKLKMYAEMSLA